MSTEVKVPVLGESVTEASVGQWLKQPGEQVRMDEPIASLETDKVAIEVNAPAAGVLGAHLVKEGDTVSVGALLSTIEDSTPAAGAEPVAKRTEPAVPPASDTMPPKDAATTPGTAADTTLSPAVRKAVLEHGIDPSTIQGTGKDGRLTKEDVLAAAQSKQASPAPAAPATPAAVVPSQVFRCSHFTLITTSCCLPGSLTTVYPNSPIRRAARSANGAASTAPLSVSAIASMCTI